MNTEVHPAIAAMVLIATGLSIALWTWSSGVAASIGGPAELSVDPRGHRFVQIQNYLVEHDADGAFLRTRDLAEIDVELFLGGYAFFSNGDILLRRGADPRSFLDNIRAYRRQTNQNAIVPDQPDSGLFRCDLDAAICDRFGVEGIDFKASYGVFIDWQSDEVYISDTTRHLLRKYSADGVELSQPVGGFKFPNNLMLYDGRLLVADTNHHVIRRLEASSAAFAQSIDQKDVVPDLARAARQTWPSHFARVGNEWWVNNMMTGMNHGGVYVFDDDWQFVKRIDLGRDADPFSILPVGDEVWISDWNNDVVRRFSVTGKRMPDLDSAGLESILERARQARLTYTILSYAGVLVVAVMLLGLYAHARAARRTS